MKVLVTGGAGFIGSHIVDALIEQGIKVVVVDNLARGLRRNVNPNAAFYQISILEKKLRHVFNIERPDVVIHEAAQTDVNRSVMDSLYDARINILGAINVLDNCVKFGIHKMIYASSCAIYGTPEYLPLNEDHPLNSISPYGVSKQTVEKYLYVYQNIYGLDYCALRYSNVYGPRQNPAGEAGAIAIFSQQMLSGRQPRIYGNGEKTRNYVYVSDIVKANLMAINNKCNGIFNIGTPEETTDQQIFDMVSRHSVYNGSPRYMDERPGEIKRMCLDSSKALKELGWIPDTQLEDGIALTVQHYATACSGRISNLVHIGKRSGDL